MSFAHPFLASSVFFSLWWGVLLSSVKTGSWLRGLAVLSQSQCLHLQSKEIASEFPSAVPVLVPDCLASRHRSRVFCHFTLGSLQTSFGQGLPSSIHCQLQWEKRPAALLSPSPCTHQRGSHLSWVWPGCQLLVSNTVVGDCSLFGT